MPAATNGYSNLSWVRTTTPNAILSQYVQFPHGVTVNKIRYAAGTLAYCFGGGGTRQAPLFFIGFPQPQFNAKSGYKASDFKNWGSFTWGQLTGLGLLYGVHSSAPISTHGFVMPATP